MSTWDLPDENPIQPDVTPWSRVGTWEYGFSISNGTVSWERGEASFVFLPTGGYSEN
jgi:hypothetical protein